MASSALFACSHAGSNEPTAAVEPDPVADAAPQYDEAATSLQEHHRHHNHGGVTAFIAMGLDTLGADPVKHDQLEKIAKDLNARMEPAREAEKHLVLTLADGIAAGKIDPAKVDADLAKLSHEASAVNQASADSLNALHTALSGPERAALVEKVEAHWEVWRKVNHDAEPGGHEEGGRLDHLAHQLNLTPDQVTQISDTLHKSMGDMHDKFNPQNIENHVHAFSTAFVADKFDAKSLNMGANANGDMATHGAQRMAMFYEKVSPLLTAEQRAKLAEHLHAHLNFQQVHEAK